MRTRAWTHTWGGYSAHVRLPPDECRAGIELWWQSRLQNTWTYDAFLRDGNERVVQLLPAMHMELEALSNAAFRRDLAERFVAAAGARP